MTIKAPVAEHAAALKRVLQNVGEDIAESLGRVGTVHFARFMFLENDTKFAIITSYDGPFDVYINDFIEHVGPLFNEMLKHMEGAPPIPVEQYRKEFIEYTRRNDVAPAASFYSAYGDLTVQNILQGRQ